MATMPPTPGQWTPVSEASRFEAPIAPAAERHGEPHGVGPAPAPEPASAPEAQLRHDRRLVRIAAIIVVCALVLGTGAALLLRYLHGEQLAAAAPATGEATVRQFVTAATRHDEKTVGALVVPGYAPSSAASVFDPATYMVGDPAIDAVSDLTVTFHTSPLSASATADTSGIAPQKATAPQRALDASVQLQVNYSFRVGSERHRVSTNQTVTLVREFLGDDGAPDPGGRWPSRWLIQAITTPSDADISSDLTSPGGTQCSEAEIVHTLEAAMLKSNALGSTCLAGADIGMGGSMDTLTHNAIITAEVPVEITGWGSDNAFVDRTGIINAEAPGGPLLEHVVTAGSRQFVLASAIADTSAWSDPNTPEYRVFAVAERTTS